MCRLHFQALQRELEKKKADYDNLNKNADDLSNKGARPVVEPTWLELTRRWHEIETRFLQYRRPVAEDVIVEESVGDVQANFSLEKEMPPEKPQQVEEYRHDLQKLRDDILQLEKDLNSPQLNGSAFDNFSEKEDKLKVSTFYFIILPCTILLYQMLNSEQHL